MSTRRLKWTGLSCLALSVVTAGLGFVVQLGLVLAQVLLVGCLLVPVSAVGGHDGPLILTVPRVLPAMLLVAGLFLAAALACFVESVRRGRTLRMSA